MELLVAFGICVFLAVLGVHWLTDGDGSRLAVRNPVLYAVVILLVAGFLLVAVSSVGLFVR